MMVKRTVVGALAALSLGACAGAAGPAGAPGPEAGYEALVVAESADQLARVRFRPGEGAEVVARREVGRVPVEVEGPHGLAISSDGRYYYISIAHGTPYGSLVKYDARTGEVVGSTTLGLFPATVGLTPEGEYGFVANFNLHGDPVPSSISKVHLPTMTEVTRTETCVMPHGSRVDRQGAKQYSVCMMDQVLVEIDVATGEVSRLFSLAPGRVGPIEALAVLEAGHAGHSGHDGAGAEVCSPTWAEPDATGDFVYVACNKSDEVLEIDTRAWEVSRRFATGPAPYNLDASPDGRLLVVTLKNRTAPATEIIDLREGRTLARVPNSTTLPHGVSVTADSRYAFVSAEGVGAEPGKVDVIDLERLERVASASVGPQAGGIEVVP